MASPPQGGPMAIAMRLRNQLQAVYKMDPLRNEEEVKVKMKELNEHIVCCLCAGYFIDATTITECLHTFCKSCIVKYLQTSKYCPMCNTKIHETQPLLNLKLDRVMQDIVYKLVPGLQESEEKRIREFYQSRGLDRVTQPSSEDTVGGDPMGLPYSTFDHSRAHYFRYDEHVSLCLEKQSSSKDKSKAVLQVSGGPCSRPDGSLGPEPLGSAQTWPHSPRSGFGLQKYVRCSVRAQIRHLRRVLCHRLELPLQHVQILFNNEALPDHMTMKQLWLSHWFGKVDGRAARAPPAALQHQGQEEVGAGGGRCPPGAQPCSHGPCPVPPNLIPLLLEFIF
ncbi:polycomb group RING finger protein 1 isoform X1 [Falco naumanni]|uniref:polycomb group RING finger protein 1 isoform X1 n=1 Tax=Falco naumanni TaxID=148594 RepID=UPI001ADE109D|nr:polycomb group RING finger protein 1 isoform X1 [Falco naumanni]